MTAAAAVEPVSTYQDIVAARRVAVSTMLDYRVNDVAVFGSDPSDLQWSAAQEAHALCIVLGASIDEMNNPSTDEIPIRSPHIARCFDAVATLIALSQFAGEAVKR